MQKVVVMQKIREFVKKEIVMVVSLVLAIASMLIVPVDRNYLDYVDFRTL